MCETAIRQAVIDKFNKHYKWNVESFEDLINKEYEPRVANEIINSLTICDPAVGSGHFLVSALNEIILIKFQLNCLFDTNGNRIKKTDYDITVENDELIISDKDGELWQYHPNNEESRRIQEAIFNEKRTIIENCLFGVDINPNSVNICRLRLWIELLKNAYYTEESDYKKLETLPNIDINIKCGNSLLQKYEIKGDIENQNIKNYKEAVKKYKSVKSKEAKSDINNLIVEIKAKFADKISKESDVMKKYKQAEREWFNARQVKLFDDEKPAKLKKQDEKKLKEVTKKYMLAMAAKDEALMNPIFKEGFEWRMEFPEILDDNGNFIGFDIVIGNPPYINIANIKEENYRNFLKSSYSITKNKCDLYAYFVELSLKLMKPGALLSFIIPHTWKATDSFSKFRELIFNNHSVLEIVNLDMTVFEATVLPLIISIREGIANKENINVKSKNFTSLFTISLDEIFNSPNLCIDTTSSLSEKQVLSKIEQDTIPLSNIIEFSRGIKTSNDKKFLSQNIIDSDSRKVYRGRNIKAYQLNWDNEYIWYKPDLMRQKEGSVPHSADFFEVPEKLIVQRVNSSNQLLVAYDNQQQYFLDTTNVSDLKTWDKITPLKLLCGMLNSRLLNFWYSKKYILPTIGGYELKTIPIKRGKFDSHIIELSNKLIESSDIDKDIMKQIDILVYKQYEITYDDILIIEGGDRISREEYN